MAVVRWCLIVFTGVLFVGLLELLGYGIDKWTGEK
jgi:hypothetical protein